MSEHNQIRLRIEPEPMLTLRVDDQPSVTVTSDCWKINLLVIHHPDIDLFDHCPILQQAHDWFGKLHRQIKPQYGDKNCFRGPGHHTLFSDTMNSFDAMMTKLRWGPE